MRPVEQDPKVAGRHRGLARHGHSGSHGESAGQRRRIPRRQLIEVARLQDDFAPSLRKRIAQLAEEECVSNSPRDRFLCRPWKRQSLQQRRCLHRRLEPDATLLVQDLDQRYFALFVALDECLPELEQRILPRRPGEPLQDLHSGRDLLEDRGAKGRFRCWLHQIHLEQARHLDSSRQ
jgi:hypothetical protein